MTGAIQPQDQRRPRSAWPPARTDKLKALFLAGKSYLLIAEEMNTTKGVIGNKIDREGWTRPATIETAPKRPCDARAARPSKRKAEPGRHITLIDLEPGECRWPTVEGEGGLQLFCGEAAIEGRSYCDCHHKRAYRRPHAWERKAVQDPEAKPPRDKLALRSDGIAGWR